MSQGAVITVGPPSLYGRCLGFVARLLFRLLLGASSLTPQQARRRLDFVGGLSKRLKGMRRHEVQAGALQAQWLHPESGVANGAVILYLHGGGYVSGSIRSHWEMAARLARAARARCLIIDYRLAPEHPFPAALEDSVAAWRWLLDQGLRPEQLFLAGDSAGGGLCLATALKLRELGLPQPAGIYCMSPWTDVSLGGASILGKQQREVVLTNPVTLRNAARDYAAGEDHRHPLISPLHADLTGMPPILIHTGTDEVLLDDSSRLHANAVAAGVNCRLKLWQGMWHVWPLFASFGLPEAHRALTEAAQFIQNLACAAAPAGSSPRA